MRVAAALALARERGVARLDAQLLLAHLLQRPRAWLLAHDDAEVDAAAVAAGLERRAGGEPLAYIVGACSFMGLDLRVTRDVLVPRPETEGLVDWALEIVDRGAVRTAADLGTGSGAIALALKQRRPALALTATDASPAALAVAADNAARHGLDIDFVAGDWWAPLAGRRFDLVVSNPPYIAGDDAHLAALKHEPPAALTPGGDGLGALRRIVAAAPAHLAPGAWLLLEHGYDQAEAVRALLEQQGYADVQSWRDLGGIERVSGGRLPG